MKFRTDVPGTVTGVRFYKGTGNTGTHTGQLWSATGIKLAEVTFSNETASGWQEASFSRPVTIAADTTYIVSYVAPYGQYAIDTNFSWTSLAVPPLYASGSASGVYTYGWGVRFPTSTWNASNYWVDLVFVSNSAPTTSTFSISGTVSGSPATLTLSGAAGALTKTDSTGKYQFTDLAKGLYVVAPSQSGYLFSPSTTSVSISATNVTGINFTGTAAPVVSHSVTLSWVDSTSTGVVGYNIYRSSSGGSYTQVNAALVTGTSWVDSSVISGSTYSYVATAVNSNNTESSYSTSVSATVPL